MARTRAAKSAKGPPQTPTVQTAPPLRRSIRSTRKTQPVHDVASDQDDSNAIPKKPDKVTKKPPTHPQEVTGDQLPPGPRYNTRSKQVQSSEPTHDVLSGDEDDVEELPVWPRYKDDLPNAFNGEVDSSQDFVSKAPVEIIDNILSFLILDHEPDRGVKMKEGNYKPRPHVLISMSAMSRLFYHAVEGFAKRFLMNPHNPEHYQADAREIASWEKAAEEKASKLRRSSRLSSKPQPKASQIYRIELLRTLQYRCAICLKYSYTPGMFTNFVSTCKICEVGMNGGTMTLTTALKAYDLRDYMLLKSRKPGPRAKVTNLPVIPYSSEYKAIGFPVFKTTTVFHFRCKDLRRLADLVHGDWVKHMNEKWRERDARQEKARTKRVRKFIIEYHERELEVSTGRTAKRHEARLIELRKLAPDEEEDGVMSRFGCSDNYCYHNVGLCDTCGDTPGRNDDECPECYSSWVDRRFEQFYSRALAQPAPEDGIA